MMSTGGFDQTECDEQSYMRLNFEDLQVTEEFDLEQNCLMRLKSQREKVYIIQFRSKNSPDFTRKTNFVWRKSAKKLSKC